MSNENENWSEYEDVNFIKSIEDDRDRLYRNDFKKQPYIFTQKTIEYLKQQGLIKNIEGKPHFNGIEVVEDKPLKFSKTSEI